MAEQIWNLLFRQRTMKALSLQQLKKSQLQLTEAQCSTISTKEKLISWLWAEKLELLQFQLSAWPMKLLEMQQMHLSDNLMLKARQMWFTLFNMAFWLKFQPQQKMVIQLLASLEMWLLLTASLQCQMAM